LYRGLVFLVVSCPCALVISIPLGFFCGIGGASSRGIMVKGGNYLEALADVETAVFDKTGTLTEGKFTVTDIEPADGVSEAELLQLATTAEQSSTHPIALSFVAAYDRLAEGADSDISRSCVQGRDGGADYI
jgi:Cd2+/Zn2+-exporting ATPase